MSIRRQIGRCFFFLLGGLIIFGCHPQVDHSNNTIGGAFRIPELSRTYAQVTCDGKIVGSGFFLEHRGLLATNMYFVTAGHVASNLLGHFHAAPYLELRIKSREKISKAIGLRISLTPQEGNLYWFRHASPAVDLAVFPVTLPTDNQNICPVIWDSVTNTESGEKDAKQNIAPMLLTQKLLEKYDIVPGNEILMLGAIAQLQAKMTDPKEFLVSFRKGIVAAMPACEVLYSYGGKTKMFIVDCPVSPGDSGGPVYVVIDRSLHDDKKIADSPYLLGIAVSSIDTQRLLTGEGKSTRLMGENSGLSLVVPAEQLAEIFIDLDRRSGNVIKALFN